MKYIILYIFLILVISTNAQNNSDTAKLQHYPVDVENKFIVFLSKYIFMPYIINYGLSIVFFYMVELSNRKLIDKAVSLCGTAKVNELTDKNLDDLVKRANKLINPSTSTSRSPKTGSPKAQNNTNTSSTK
jgi:hypothetical protein